MDQVVAARMVRELTGQSVGGWTLAECIGYGKSALVFRASNGSKVGALKVFDRELVERFGKVAQHERVRREAQLVGKKHPNVIEIFDAGEDTAHDVFFVVMDLFPGKNLKDALPLVPHAQVFDLIRQIAQGAEFLETLGLVHRDIKPENIGVSDDFSKAVLLDLGVMRPIGFSSITDQDGQRSFVGTLQYSPPELLHREEMDSLEGWRAVTFYQLGGVLHDLLVRQPLFCEHLSPYAHLVDAVSRMPVTINAPGTAPELRMLAQDCLVKEPQVRLQLVTWDRFKKAPGPVDDLHSIRERIAQRRRGNSVTGMSLGAGIVEQQAVDDLRTCLDRLLRDACKQSGLPSFVVQSDESQAAVRIRFTFGPSRVHALTGCFAVYVEGAILDPAEHVIQCHVSVAVATDIKFLPAESKASARALVFQGVQANDVLSQRLTKMLLVALDCSQERCSPGQFSAEPYWLSLVEEQ